VKYEIDKASGALFVDRFLHTAMLYQWLDTEAAEQLVLDAIVRAAKTPAG